MKVKDFKMQLKNEHLDIPNVLDNIKNVAYNAEFKPKTKQSYFKLNTFLKYSISFCLFIILGVILIPNLSNPGAQMPESASPDTPSSEIEGNLESPENSESFKLDNLSKQEIDIYTSYLANNYSSTIELFENFNVSGNVLLKATINNQDIIILNYEIFNYIRLSISKNNNISLDECLNDIYINYGLSEQYYETISNAYTFIIEKDQ